MTRRPPSTTRTDPLFPYTAPFRSASSPKPARRPPCSTSDSAGAQRRRQPRRGQQRRGGGEGGNQEAVAEGVGVAGEARPDHLAQPERRGQDRKSTRLNSSH